ncbi:hypothetical protein [Streptomyces sp. NBRC 110465]|uniref:hypothetical protein n=1 Tax=Streptomyces sp. NBRC 110465 TaxID=1897621 RepID=UPI0009321FBB|nr:hypothetical protein [Streptomyces sp. NBRC 110465]
MDTQQNTALTRALAEVPGPLPTRGVIHVVIPHTDRFTVVGNHLAQHPDLSCTAIEIAVLIQSLPQGTEVSIKALAARCREGEKRIAAALRELEAHGYLQRIRHRLTDKKVITRTVFCNQPTALPHPHHPAAQPHPRTTAPADAAVRGPARVAVAAPVRVDVPVAVPAPVPVSASVPAAAPPAQEATPAPPVPGTTTAPPLPGPPSPPSAPGTSPTPPVSPPPPPPLFVPRVPPPTAPKPPRRPLPRPGELTPELDRAATAFLSDLHRHAPQFALSEDDVRRLVPGVAAWLEREARPDGMRRALTDDPPHPLKHPAKLLTYRLTELLPPAPPGADDLAALARPRVTVTPFQTCDDCDRAFRSPAPGHCRDCRETRAAHAQAAA